MDLGSPNRFKDEDKEKVVKFLNFIAKNAKFNDLDVKAVIEFYGLLSYCQQVLISKIDAHCAEIIKVHEPEPKPARKAKAKTKA